LRRQTAECGIKTVEESMDQSIYEAPSPNLNNTSTTNLSATERLAQSRKEMEEAAAIENLNIIWGLRLASDLLICGVSFWMIYEAFARNEFQFIGYSIVFLCFFLGEIVSIIGYFKRKEWCVVPLHIFSAISLANIPAGTILSILHYINMGKVNFNENA